MRTWLPALLVLCCACSGPASDPPPKRPPFAITIAGPTGPFAGLAEITATPEPADGTLWVRFSVDDEAREIDFAPPYTASLDLSGDWSGDHRITASAYRDDGATAEASMDVLFDGLGPFVTVLSPLTGARVPLEGGMIDVAFVASDPQGLAGGAVQVDDGEPIAVPLSSLALTVPIPAASSLPKKPALSWWFDDTLGNRSQGKVELLQSHERFHVSLGKGGTVLPMSDQRLAVLTQQEVRAYDADGTVAWVTSMPSTFSLRGLSAGNGELFVMGAKVGESTKVRRLHTDGSIAWEWPGPATNDDKFAHVAASDSLLVMRNVGLGGVEAVLVGPTGASKVVKSYPAGFDAWPLVAPSGASPGGFAAATGAGLGTEVMVHFDVFDPAGAPAWSCDLGAMPASSVLLTRDVLSASVSMPGGWQYALASSGGTTTVLGAGGPAIAAPNGDLVLAADSPFGAVVRVRPDGSMVWKALLGAATMRLSAAGDRVAVSTPKSIRVIDANGDVVKWMPDDDALSTTPIAVLSPSGAFYVIGTLASGDQRVYRVAADGTTLWYETLHEQGALVPEPTAPDDERLVISVSGNTWNLHVFEP